MLGELKLPDRIGVSKDVLMVEGKSLKIAAISGSPPRVHHHLIVPAQGQPRKPHLAALVENIVNVEGI